MRLPKAINPCFALILVSLFALSCRQSSEQAYPGRPWTRPAGSLTVELRPPLKQVVEAGLEQTKYTFYYDPSYTRIKYPGGDVARERGVCTDVIIRAFRQVGVDLQKEVHEDMRRNFARYPNKWGLTSPDSNIDHRRVPNLRTYFERKGKALAISSNPADYLPGDIVTWDIGRLPHIGMVTNIRSEDGGNLLLVHNVGRGVRVEDVLFAWPITGHYRYF
jgi:uncharacterized protein YijF (DUF1287 family)